MTVSGEGILKVYIRENNGSNVFNAVNKCNIALNNNTVTVIKGRSGSGKSTLLNMLSGILIPSEGRILYDDRDIYSLSDKELSGFRREHTGIIPQGKSAVAALTVYENIVLPYTFFNEEIDDYKAKWIEELIKRLDISGIRDAMPSELSGGELRRMAIARALAKEPDVVYADEPTGNLDDDNTGVVMDLLKEYALNGHTVLIVTHDSEAFSYADVVYRMNAGELEIVK